MLRITQIQSNGSLVLKLEGKLVGPWTQELLAQLPRDQNEWAGARLDLAQVSFVDSQGAALLRGLLDCGARIENASPFVAELLHARKL